MKMSCNGCRVLRKGCTENCTIRPCLQWIKSSDSQANATLFLAKFYGRAGLLNLINAGPQHLRPAIFRSLLYDACGRIVSPIYGSVGLMWSGSWQLCQAAVEAVLKGAPITQVASDSAASPCPAMKPYDIRHVSKEDNPAATQELHRVKTRTRFKQKPKKSNLESAVELVSQSGEWGLCDRDEFYPAPSHDSSLSHQSELNVDTDSAFSFETVEEASLVGRAEPEPELELELRLGLERVSGAGTVTGPMHVTPYVDWPGRNTCNVELGLDLSA